MRLGPVSANDSESQAQMVIIIEANPPSSPKGKLQLVVLSLRKQKRKGKKAD